MRNPYIKGHISFIPLVMMVMVMVVMVMVVMVMVVMVVMIILIIVITQLSGFLYCTFAAVEVQVFHPSIPADLNGVPVSGWVPGVPGSDGVWGRIPGVKTDLNRANVFKL